MRLYLDTMVWIYALENHPEFGAQAQRLLRQIRLGGHTTLTSHFLLAELLVPHVRRADHFTVAAYRRMLLASTATEVVPFGTEAAMHFAAVRATHRVKQPDAIHLALAASIGTGALCHHRRPLAEIDHPRIALIGNLGTSVP